MFSFSFSFMLKKNMQYVKIKQTMKSLFGMESKREGFIQPSVTSQPPRLTALIF